MKPKILAAFVLCLLMAGSAYAAKLFIPMDSLGQTNHLKAYGIAFAAMQKGIKVDWLLNYKGGSFAMEYDNDLADICNSRNVSYEKISNKEYSVIIKKINGPAFNGAVVTLDKVPKIAVYTPPNKEPWDDAVTLALTYAEIPFDKLYADEVLAGALDKYDWLHLHHEDFTGQYGKFWSGSRNTVWYQKDQHTMETIATKNGYKKVQQLQAAVVKKIRDFVGGGGNLFAMCSATETFDIALAADGVDICDTMFDGDPADANAQGKLDYSHCLAFKDFKLNTNPYAPEYSDINNISTRYAANIGNTFRLSQFQARENQLSAMLCQNHTDNIKDFKGKTSSFSIKTLRPDVTILGDRLNTNVTTYNIEGQLIASPRSEVSDAQYIHGEYGNGTWTFYGGHDPEDYEHYIGAPPTDLSQHPHSPGYRLILNNALSPAAKRVVTPTVFCCDSMNTPAPQSPPGLVHSANLKIADFVKIYPNPANSEILISASKSTTGDVVTTIEKVEVLDISGKLALTRSFNAQQATIDMKGLKPGMYMIKVNGENVGKVIKD